MKETIYTIPVNEAYDVACECPLCLLEHRFEADRVNYYLGPSLMEPENRIETNKKGFCGKHFSMMYATQTNRLGLGLIIDTYLQEQNEKLEKMFDSFNSVAGEKKSLLASLKGDSAAGAQASKISKHIEEHLSECCICKDLDYTMDRYVEIILHLFFSEKDFREKFEKGLGYCIPHLNMLIKGSEKHLGSSRQSEFLRVLFDLQRKNMQRIQEEVNWFTKKFDYRNNDAPWGNSKDSVLRSIRKISGAKDLE